MDIDWGVWGPRLAVAGVAAALVWSQWPQIQAKMARDAAVAQASQASLLKGQQLEADKLLRAKEAEIANARYDQGCELLLQSSDQSKAGIILQGWPVILGEYAKFYKKGTKLEQVNPGHTLAAGVTVCDAYGVTAVLVPSDKYPFAVIDQIAATPDRTRMRNALQARKEVKRGGVSNGK